MTVLRSVVGSFRRQALLAIVVILLTAIALRWDVISLEVRLNPDEGEIMAAGRRAGMQWWLPMSTFSANTYFPLWPTSLGILAALGVPMTLYSAHVLSAVLAAAILSMLWVGVAPRWGWGATTALLAPGGWALLANTADFKQLSTELPSVFLLVLAARIAFPYDTGVRARRLALAAAVASLAPWFKPQSGPLAVAVVISACLFCYISRDGAWEGREWRSRAAWLVAGGLGPSVFLVGLMLLGGTFQAFWEEPVGFLLAYLTHSVGGLAIGSMTAPISTKISTLIIYVLSQFFVFLWAFIGLRGVWLMPRDSRSRPLIGLVVWALPVVVSLLTLLVLWPIFLHYLLFLYAGTAIAALAGSALPRSDDAAGRDRLLLALFRDAIARRLVLGAVLATLALMSVIKPGIEIDRNVPRSAATSTLCGAGSSVFIWGWAAELYAYYDWQPASRFVTYGMLRAETPHQQDYRDRFFGEMDAGPPQCVVNAGGEGWFHPEGTPVADLEAEMPTISPMLSECYQRHVVDAGTDAELVVWTRLATC